MRVVDSQVRAPGVWGGVRDVVLLVVVAADVIGDISEGSLRPK